MTPNFDEMYTTARVPWDLGEPQPPVVALERAGRLFGTVLDAGCGLGDNAIYLARRGNRVIGIDAAAPAIAQARHRATEHEVDVEFAVADAATLTGFDHHFDTVLDCALYHCLTEEQRTRYIAALYRATKPGALLSMLCFSDRTVGGLPAPFPVSEHNIRGTLGANGWEITDLRPGELPAVTESAREFVSRYPNAVTDGEGRVLMPIWIVAAERSASSSRRSSEPLGASPRQWW